MSVNDRPYYPGFDLLKILAAYLVVDGHFGCAYLKMGAVYTLNSLAVPIFLIASFFLAGSKLSVGICKCWRFWLIFMSWGFIYAVFSLVTGGGLSVSMLVKQLVFGVGYCNPLYYLLDVILLMLLLAKVCKAFNGHQFIALLSVMFIALMLQYSGINEWSITRLFAWDFRVMHAVGRILEFLPYACVGLLLYYKRDASRRAMLVVGLLLCVIGGVLCFVADCPPGFTFQGVPLLLVCSGIFILFMLLPELPLSSVILRQFGRLTLGVYVMHMMIGTVARPWIGNSIWMPATVFVIALGLSLALSKVRYIKYVIY